MNQYMRRRKPGPDVCEMMSIPSIIARRTRKRAKARWTRWPKSRKRTRAATRRVMPAATSMATTPTSTATPVHDEMRPKTLRGFDSFIHPTLGLRQEAGLGTHVPDSQRGGPRRPGECVPVSSLQHLPAEGRRHGDGHGRRRPGGGLPGPEHVGVLLPVGVE